jgi:hypothetical protein
VQLSVQKQACECRRRRAHLRSRCSDSSLTMASLRSMAPEVLFLGESSWSRSSWNATLRVAARGSALLGHPEVPVIDAEREAFKVSADSGYGGQVLLV